MRMFPNISKHSVLARKKISAKSNTSKTPFHEFMKPTFLTQYFKGGSLCEYGQKRAAVLYFKHNFKVLVHKAVDSELQNKLNRECLG